MEEAEVPGKMSACRAGGRGGVLPSRARRPKLGVAAFALALALLLLPSFALGAPVGTASHGGGPVTPGSPPAASPQGSLGFNTSGNVTVVFDQQAPAVTLFQAADPSVRTTLSFEHILEVSYLSRGAPGSHGPMGLLARAYALPSGSTPWTSAVSGDLATPEGVWVNFTSNITVLSLSQPGLTGVPLWQNPNGEIPPSDVGARLGGVEVQVSFHLTGTGTPGKEGLAKVGVVVSGWPWVDPTDALALEWQFFAPENGTETVACSSPTPPANGTSSSPCSSQMGLGVGQPIWSNSTTAVEAVELGGLVSFVSWSDTGTITNALGISQSVALGTALYPVSGSDMVRLLQTLPMGLGALSQFREDPTLGLVPVLPPGACCRLPSLPPVVQGDLGTFLVATLATAAVVLGAIAIRRRSDRRALERF